ncbi:steroid hormone receptor ERR1 [Galendromus occidentalis]|uniref:Steroid hormone receptor ERR1 n=1 Tax=Galendromus occidentalis TaxID=34638 RepID=A0AAJ6VXK6_9ACAR|nr:steroid hormone receptor ERR1 [Galendromus occidentalis]
MLHHHMIKREDSNSSIGSSSTPPPVMLSSYSEAATALYNNVVKRSVSPSHEEQMSFISEFTYSDDIGEASQSPPLSPELNTDHQLYLGMRSVQSAAAAQQVARVEQGSPRRVCLVCGDVASGYHYGVASCEACKAFFKRTIQGNIEYTCPANNDCEINKRRRKACQACRFQKCLKTGMLKEGVRLDRVRGGRQKYRRNPEGPYQVAAQPIKRITIDENTIISALIACEPPTLSISMNKEYTNAFCDSKTALAALGELIDRELVNIIGWARQIPGFSQIHLDDQMRLLQMSWGEVLSLTLAFRSMESSDGLSYANDLTLSQVQAEEMGLEEIFLYTKHLVQRLNAIRIFKEEYLALKAMALINADTVLENSTLVYKMRESISQSLQDCILTLSPSTNNAAPRMAQLLLLLPLLRHLDVLIRQFWQRMRSERNATLNKLLCEMLEWNMTFKLGC